MRIPKKTEKLVEDWDNSLSGEASLQLHWPAVSILFDLQLCICVVDASISFTINYSNWFSHLIKCHSVPAVITILVMMIMLMKITILSWQQVYKCYWYNIPKCMPKYNFLEKLIFWGDQGELTLFLGGLMVGKMVCIAVTPGLVDLTALSV